MQIIQLGTQCVRAADHFRTRCKYSVEIAHKKVTVIQNWIPSKRGKCRTSFNRRVRPMMLLRAAAKWWHTHCLFKTHTHIFWMCKEESRYHLPRLIEVIYLLIEVPSTGVHRHNRALNELICPHLLSQRCWMTGTPPGTLPTQTYSYSPAPAASFALCKPLLCRRSVWWRKKKLCVHLYDCMLIQLLENKK